MAPRILLALALLPAAASAVGFKLGVSPSVAYFTVRPGQTLVQEVTLDNGAPDLLQVELQRVDAWHTETGRTHLEPGKAPQGLGRWLSAPSERLEIAPHGRASFTATAFVPPGAAPGTYLGGFVAAVSNVFEPEAARRASGLAAAAAVKPQVAILFHADVLTPDGRRPSRPAELLDMAIDPPSATKPLGVRVLLSNPSIYEAKLPGTVAVFSAAGRPIGRVRFNEAELWPGQKKWVEAQVPLVFAEGITYQALVAFTQADGPPLSRGAAFTVAPPPPIQPPTFETTPPPRRKKPGKKAGK